MPSPILIFGANGQVGSALLTLLGNKAIGLTRSQADFSHPEMLQTIAASYHPSAIINACAYTAVDKAESEEELAYTVNATAPEVLAHYAASAHIPFIHYSTDYVFNGSKSTPWDEEDTPAPLSAYGRTKLAGEEKIRACGGKWLNFRTSWVYDESGKNFLNTMLRLGKERETLNIVNDQFGAPTYAPALAEATIKALDYASTLPQFPSGTYHLCGGGGTNWQEFAEEIFVQARIRGIDLEVRNVEGIPTSAYPTPATRPLNSQMNCQKAKELLHIELPLWQESLKTCMERKYERHTV